MSESLKGHIRPYQIYRLVDPRFPVQHEDYVRYVGKTHQYLRQRLTNHWATRNNPTGPKAAWLRELKSVDFRPKIQLIEVVPAGTTPSASSREFYWMGYHSAVGYNLLNEQLCSDTGYMEGVESSAKARKELNSLIREVEREAALHSGFAEHVRWRNESTEDVERRLLDRIERGEFEEPLASRMREILTAEKPSPATSIAANLDNYPALKHYVQMTQEKGDEWFIFFHGREPSEEQRRKVKARIEEAKGEGWKGFGPDLQGQGGNEED